MPWILSTLNTQFVRDNCGLEGFEHIRVLRSSQAGWTPVLAGRLDPSRVEWFIRRNGLQPDATASHVCYELREWEKNWPADADWYSRHVRRPGDTCRMHCYTTCLLDRRTGRVWISVRTPDFAGD